MEVRRSRRLLGLIPEVDEFKGKCFICQGDLVIDSLTRCSAKTYCCEKFLHKRCLQQELQYSDRCGHCKTSNPRGNEDEAQLSPWKEVVRERITNATNAINRYRRGGRPYHIHNPNIVSIRGGPCRTMRIFPSGLNFIQDSPSSCSKGETLPCTSMPMSTCRG